MLLSLVNAEHNGAEGSRISHTSGVNAMGRHLAVFVMGLMLSPILHSQCAAKQDHRANKGKGIIVENVILDGTHSLDSAEIAGVVGAISGSCFDEAPDVIAQFIRGELQSRGYMMAKVEHVRIEPGDVLAVPKPVSIKADVTEGLLYHVGDLRFQGNEAFTVEQLAHAFPMKPGGIFNRSRLSGGMSALRTLYASAGYIDVVFIPEVQTQSAQSEKPQVLITFVIDEGKQYHMAKLRVFGTKEQAAALERHWNLAQGTPFDATYPHKFLEENREVLPDSFQERQGLRIYRDCRDATVTVAIIVDWREATSESLSDTGCEQPKASQL